MSAPASRHIKAHHNVFYYRRIEKWCVCARARYEMLQDNVEGYRKEIASLREKAQKQAASGQKSEQTLHALTQDLRAANEKLSMVEVSVFVQLYVFSSSLSSCFCFSQYAFARVITKNKVNCAWQLVLMMF